MNEEFIRCHNISIQSGIEVYKLSKYTIIADFNHNTFRTILNEKRENTAFLETPKKLRSKINSSIKGKFNETERPFIPVVFRSAELFNEYQDLIRFKTSLSSHPTPVVAHIGSASFAPTSPNIFLRIPVVSHYISRSTFTEVSLSSPEVSIDKIIIEIGQGILESTIGFQK